MTGAGQGRTSACSPDVWRKGGEEMALTLKQKKFVEEYVISGNAADAARRAGYSPRTAYSIGDENLRKPEVLAYRDELLQKMESEKIAQADEVLQFLTAVMRRETGDRKALVCDGVVTQVELPTSVSDALRAAELQGKRYGLFTDKVDLTGGEIVVTITDEESGT